MKALLALLALTLAGCASLPAPVNVDALFDDAAFPPQAEPIRGADAFALSAPMQDYLAGEIALQVHRKGPRRGLFDALRNQLHIEYDSTITRTAAQAFEQRSGNCLALVILTAAFARQLGIPVEYQSVRGFDTWSRSAGLSIRSGHVNLVLGRPGPAGPHRDDGEAPLTIDFVPPSQVLAQFARPISQERVAAMYLNNRAAEILADGDAGRAYWWAREAIRTDPAFLSAHNTLGVIYMRRGDSAGAERVLRYVMAREPENEQVISNLAIVLADQGRDAEADALKATLAQIDPYPPFYYFDQGLAAMQREDFAGAVGLLEKELRRMPYDDEVHFALAVASLHLGDVRPAREHLALAMENSTTHDRRDLYAAKLHHLQALAPNPRSTLLLR